MKSDFDNFAEKLQEEILEDVRKHYSKVVIDNWMHPRNMGRMEDPDGYGRVTGPCGDTMEIFISVKKGKIIDCKFVTDGCGTSIACGSIVTELAKGKSLDKAKEINQTVALETCGGLPPDDEHCALLSSNTLIEAIRNYER
ncbi:iron-sulfur cluster assembly scaffold protein [candidate division WOR-3 bacterium]|nr:iron-sulfur cluster assembly scaffold protein [candidate division WOR-3 bacterium]